MADLILTAPLYEWELDLKFVWVCVRMELTSNKTCKHFQMFLNADFPSECLHLTTLKEKLQLILKHHIQLRIHKLGPILDFQ